MALLHRQHHLAEMPAPLEIALRLSRLRQREALVDGHLEFLFCHELENLVELLKIFRLCLQIVGDGKTRRLASLRQVGRRVGNRAERAADREETASGSKRLKTLLIDLAADHFQYNVDA